MILVERGWGTFTSPPVSWFPQQVVCATEKHTTRPQHCHPQASRPTLPTPQAFSVSVEGKLVLLFPDMAILAAPVR